MQRRPMTMLLALSLLAATTAAASAQEPSLVALSSRPSAVSQLLKKRVSLRVEDVTPAVGLMRLNEASGVPISFSPTMLPRDLRVSCRCDDVTLAVALNEILRGSGFDFVEMAAQIVIVNETPEQPVVRLASRGATPRGRVAAPSRIPGRLAFAARTLAPSRRLADAQGQITGTVAREATGEPIAAVQVFLEGTSISTLSGEEGQFVLNNVPAGTYTIVAQRIGYRTQRVDVAVTDGETTSVTLLLEESVLALDELVVTGYSTQARGNITGSVAVVDMTAVRAIPAASAAHALQGHAAGINIVSSGLAGRAPEIRIRGISNFGDVYPLVLVDGVEANLNDISADDIESIQVLKDAGAASVYGVRGANGVIVVTTRKGRPGAPVITYDSYVGVTQPIGNNPLNLMNSEEYMRTVLSVDPNNPNFPGGRMPDYFYITPDGVRGAAFEGDPAVDPSLYRYDPTDPTRNYQIQRVNKDGTDWYKELHRPAPTVNTTLSVSGGSDRTSYLASFGYLRQKGTLVNTGLERYSVRVNTSFDVGRLQIGENLNLYFRDNPTIPLHGGQFTTLNLHRNLMPLIPVRDIAGNWGGTRAGPDLGTQRNPVAHHYRQSEDRNQSWNAVGNVFAQLQLLDNLAVRTSIGGGVNHSYQQELYRTEYERSEFFSDPNRLSERQGYDNRLMWSNTLTYNAAHGRHGVQALVGSEIIRNWGRHIGGSRESYLLENYDYLTLNTGTANVRNFSSIYEDALLSYFGNLNYAFDNRYLLGLTVRRDGSSKFGPESRYGVFPSVSAGWRISEEPFFRPLRARWLDDLRLRGSYGILGSQNNVNPNNQFSIYAGENTASYYDIEGTSTSVVPGFFLSRIGNPATGWERNRVANIGLDATVLDRVGFALEFYRKSIDGLLFPLQLPATVGGGARPAVNIGDIRNTGVDLEVTYTGPLFGRLFMNLGANVGTYRNQVVHIPGDADYFDAGNNVRNQEGYPVSSFFGYEVIGLFQSEEDVANSPQQQNAAPGRFKYRDVNGDGIIDADDRTHLGSPNPDFVYGINLGLSLGNIDLSTQLYGSHGGKINNFLKTNSHSLGSYVSGLSRDLLNAWTPENPDTDIPVNELSRGFGTVGTFSSFQVEDASFFRMRSLMLGYTVSGLQRFGMSRLRLYGQATNVFTLTGYSGIDPEIGGSSMASFGVDTGNYANSERRFVFGMNVAF